MSAPDLDGIDYLDDLRERAYVVPMADLLRRCLALCASANGPELPAEWIPSVERFIAELDAAESWQREDIEIGFHANGPVKAAIIRVAEHPSGAAARAALAGRSRFVNPPALRYRKLALSLLGDGLPVEHQASLAEVDKALDEGIVDNNGGFWSYVEKYEAFLVGMEMLRNDYYRNELDKRFGSGAGDNWDPEFGLPSGVPPPNEEILKERWINWFWKSRVYRTEPIALDTIKQYLNKRWPRAHAKKFPSTKYP